MKKEKNVDKIPQKKKQKIKKNKGIGFFKKIKYSLIKIDKYDEMVDEGFGKAVKYFIELIAFIALVMSIAVVVCLAISGTVADDITIAGYCTTLIYYFFVITLAFIYFFAIIILIISLCTIVLEISFNIREKIEKAISRVIYCSTLSIIVFALLYCINYTYTQLIALLLIYLYVGISLYKKRRESTDDIHRTNKKQSEK